MKRRDRLFGWLFDSFHLSDETLPWQSIIEMAGAGRILVENHGGITQYNSGCICVKVSYGIVDITGEDMKILFMSKNQLVITGKIHSVSLVKGD